MRLKELREEKCLTQSEVSKAIGGTQSNFAKWEKGLVQPPAEAIIRLADFFNVSADYLLGRSDELGVVTLPQSERLSSDERELLRAYRALSKKYRALALDTVRAMSGGHEEAVAPKFKA